MVRGVCSSFMASARSLRNTRAIVLCGMLVAVQVGLNFVSSVQLGPYVRISFGFLALAATGALLGPAPAMANAVLADLLLCVLKPTGPYFPGYTFSAALTGLTYGLFFYRKEITWLRVLLAELTVALIVHLGLNTLWTSLLYGKAFIVLIQARAIKNAAQLPVDVALLMPMLRFARRLWEKNG